MEMGEFKSKLESESVEVSVSSASGCDVCRSKHSSNSVSIRKYAGGCY